MQLNRRKISFVVILLSSFVLLRLLPKADLALAYPSSRSVTASHGELLRLTLASDDQYRLWTPISQIAKPMQQAALLYEDRSFYWHFGVNPVALIRATFSTILGSRRIGGSTITMQLARRLYNIDSRSITGKIKQVSLAIWLELRYSKREILEAYLNYAPYGGNIIGVGAASLVYLHKPALQLKVNEAINLAVIPQNPNKRLAENSLPSQSLITARTRLAQLWLAENPQDAAQLSTLALNLLFKNRKNLAFAAPHFAEYVLRNETAYVVNTSLDLPMQQTLERVLTKYVKSRQDEGIKNASALLIDSTTMQVKALVGSADYHNIAIEGQVNGVLGKRSPGSTLKPFIYALALDQGLIHSASILKDAPSNFGVFTPENFDGRFNGPISAQDALIRSRNIPAVSLAAKLRKPSLYDFLKLAHIQKLQSEQHYGLALVLGGGEVTMEELAQLYAILPNHGEWREVQYLQNSQHQAPIRLLSDEAAYIVLDMLRRTPRPDTFTEARPAIAWKTGTSWGFRDAWTAGVFGRYVLVVWVGNFDGASNPALIGIETAAPLFMRIVDAFRAQQLDAGSFVTRQPANLQRVTVCAASGDLPNIECPLTTQAWFIPGKSPAKISTLHRTVHIDSRTALVVCQPNEFSKPQVFEYWSSDMQSLFKRAGMPLRKPPEDICNGVNNQEQTLNIITPMRGVTHLQRLNRQEPLLLRAEASASSGNLYWFADNALIGQTKPSETMSWLPPHAGKYGLRVVDNNGNSDTREISVESVE